MSNFSDFYGGGIKSVQRGVLLFAGAGTVSATVSPVNPAKSELRFLGTTFASTYISVGARIELANSTTVKATQGDSASSGIVVGWELTEYN